MALRVAGDLADQLEHLDFAEWLDPQGTPRGARQFLASVAMPLLTLRSLAEKPLLEYF